MQILTSLGIVFVVLAVIFAGLVFRDYLRSEKNPTSARKTWLRIAVIFSSIGVFLYVLRIISL